MYIIHIKKRRYICKYTNLSYLTLIIYDHYFQNYNYLIIATFSLSLLLPLLLYIIFCSYYHYCYMNVMIIIVIVIAIVLVILLLPILHHYFFLFYSPLISSSLSVALFYFILFCSSLSIFPSRVIYLKIQLQKNCGRHHFEMFFTNT